MLWIMIVAAMFPCIIFSNPVLQPNITGNITVHEGRAVVRRKVPTAEDFEKLTKEVNEIKRQNEQITVRSLVETMFPRGSIYITIYDIVRAPLDGQYGIRWKAMPEGEVLMTASQENAGQRSGSSRLDNGTTKGHKLTVNEMPKHKHDYRSPDTNSHKMWLKMGDDFPRHDYHPEKTGETGGDGEHNHSLDIKNLKVLAWKRIS